MNRNRSFHSEERTVGDKSHRGNLSVKVNNSSFSNKESNHVYPKLEAIKAYKKALTTWAKWIDKNIDLNRTQVFFRGYSLTHFSLSGGQWNSGGQCHRETEPIFKETYLEEYPLKMKVLESVLQKMKTPVVSLNISKPTGHRKDVYTLQFIRKSTRQ